VPNLATDSFRKKAKFTKKLALKSELNLDTYFFFLDFSENIKNAGPRNNRSFAGKKFQSKKGKVEL